MHRETSTFLWKLVQEKPHDEGGQQAVLMAPVELREKMSVVHY